jgi:hypothetical protein
MLHMQVFMDLKNQYSPQPKGFGEYCKVHKNLYWPQQKSIIVYYYIRLYFTVFLLARSNTRDIPFSNILISKKQFIALLH